MKRFLAAAIVGGTAFAAMAVPAYAAPKPQPGTTISVTCGEESFNVVTPPGDGNWTPAFANGKVYIPVAFGEFHGSSTGPDGTEEFTEPARTQNAGKGGKNPRLDCTYTVTGVDGPYSFTGAGTVTVAVVGKK